MNAIKGKEFEALVIFRATKLEEEGIMTLGRYGVQARMMLNETTHQPEWKIVPSLPDFEGCIMGSGRQIIIESKVCSQASFPLYQEATKKPKQLDHMLRRARFGALCFLLIHFNERQLLKKTEPAETFAIPVHPDIHFWRMYQASEFKSINRGDADLYGCRVPWDIYSARASKLTPDLRVLLDPANSSVD